MKPFDLLNDPLQGINLIEAGAGTGKTFTIAGLYLRLVVEQGLGPERILVVTYTRAATEELKHRIRSRLTAAKSVFSPSASEGEPLEDDPWLKALAEKTTDHELARRSIDNALVEFDRAAIFTIHGFCQRVLQQFAFETGHRFQSELVQDVSLMTREIADDFWRRNVSKAPDELAVFVLDKLKGPEGFVQLLDACRYPKIRLWPRSDKPRLSAIAPWRRRASQIRRQWPLVREEVTALLQSPALNATSYGRCAKADEAPETSPRAKRIAEISAAMDLWPGTYPLFKQFALMGSDKLAAATKKKHKTPEHPFFDLCRQALEQQSVMETQLSQYLRYLKLTLLRRAARQLDEKKARRNVMSFDDLLLNVAGALSDGRNARLVQSIRELYTAALVDEFQDTDPLQYDIFTGLFGADPTVLFMIGDPKQAIYSFRGADVYAYLQAAREASRQYTLERNWRATPGLVTAVNTIFSNRPNPFATPDIGFAPAVAARRSDCQNDRQSDKGDPAEPSLHLWYFGSAADDKDKAAGKPWSKADATRLIVNAVAARIVDVLSQPNAPAPEQIAVLTRSHRQAQMTKEALSGRQVPAVLYSAGSVFDTHDALEFMRVLKAVVTPANAVYVRAALATDMLGARAGDFEADESGRPGAWEARWERFEEYRRLWADSGFFRMFSRLMRIEQVKSTLLQLPDGERRVTNLLHLAELLQQAETGQRLSPEGLLKCMAAHMQPGRMVSTDDQQLRLESDARAVQIITIHKSKGLQFDVVFCPFTWVGAIEDDDLVVFHNPDDEQHLTLALGPDIPPPYKRQGLKEDLAENLRLLYVALTRARKQCYWVWGRIRNTACCAPAFLLHGPSEAEGGSDWGQALSRKMQEATDARLLREIKEMIGRSQGSIALAPLPDHAGRLESKSAEFDWAPERVFERDLDQPWRITSFSSLTAGHGGASGPFPTEPPDIDRDQDRDRDQDVMASDSIAAGDQQGTTHPIFDFPKGTQAGLFFHDLLENWDFNIGGSDTEASGRQALINAKLTTYGFGTHWVPVIDHLLCNLAAVNLPNPFFPVTFQDAVNGRRLNEMAFYFPLNRITPAALQQAFAMSNSGSPAHADFAEAMKQLDFTPVEGFLKGYVDLIFEYRGRYFVVDWKSNHLGNRPESYTPEHLGRVMAETHYFLQYHLYVVALDQMLRQRMPDYDVDRHFGGVYYIFLRGIDRRAGSSGIHYAMPDTDLIRRLRHLLIAEKTGSIK